MAIGFQSTGKYEWERVLNYPTYGLGFSSFVFDERDAADLVGNPSGVYGFVGLPLLRGKKKRFFHIDFDAAFGLTYDLNPYDPVTNPYNDAVGSRILFYFDFGLSGNHRLSDRLDLDYGLHLIHFSNGRTRTPNLGVNMVGLDLGMKYYFNPITPYARYADPSRQLALRPEFVPKSELPKYQKYSLWNIWGAAGLNTTNRDSSNIVDGVVDLRGPTYFAATLAGEWQYKLTRSFSLGLGLNYFFDGSLGEMYEEKTPSLWERSTVGIGPTFDFYVQRFSFVGTVGFYVYRADPVKEVRNTMYLRGGIRYRVAPGFFVQAALKTMNGAVADYIEFGIGRTISNDPQSISE